MGSRHDAPPVNIGEFGFEITQYSSSDPEAYLVNNHGREVAHLRLQHGVFTTWAWRPGERDPIEIQELRMQGTAHQDRFQTRQKRDEVLAKGLEAVQRHLRNCRVNAVANEPEAPSPRLSPA